MINNHWQGFEASKIGDSWDIVDKWQVADYYVGLNCTIISLGIVTIHELGKAIDQAA